MESGSVNNASGGGAALEEPPNRLVMLEISPPSPAILPSPPPRALDSPPEIVFDNKPSQVLPDEEVLVTLLDGLPNLMLPTFSSDPSARFFSPNEDVFWEVAKFEPVPELRSSGWIYFEGPKSIDALLRLS